MTGSGEISIEVVLSRREDQLRKFTFKAKVKDERDVTIVGNSLKAMVRMILDKHLDEEKLREIVDQSEEEAELGKLSVIK
jgi:hydrogenase maturation factor